MALRGVVAPLSGATEAVVMGSPGVSVGYDGAGGFEAWRMRQPVRQRTDYPHSRDQQDPAPVLGDVPLTELRSSDVRGLQTELLTTGPPIVPNAPKPRRGTASKHEPLSPKTVKNILGGSFRTMLGQARSDELLVRDVFVDHQRPIVETPEPDPFTADDRGRLLEWFRTKTFRFPSIRAAVAGRCRRA